MFHTNTYVGYWLLVHNGRAIYMDSLDYAKQYIDDVIESNKLLGPVILTEQKFSKNGTKYIYKLVTYNTFDCDMFLIYSR